MGCRVGGLPNFSHPSITLGSDESDLVASDALHFLYSDNTSSSESEIVLDGTFDSQFLTFESMSAKLQYDSAH